jgi:putative DNA primase/helicase
LFCGNLASLPAWDQIPHLDAVVECPVFTKPGNLIREPGFHASARLWLHPAEGLVVPEIPAEPSTAEVVAARSLLFDELLGDFPFQDDASRAHALAALLLPFVRPLIDGPTPLHLFDAPVEGTGKTLLATVITLVSTGREPEGTTEAGNDDEWRKRITALLREGPMFVLLDNLNRELDSAALASVLTARMWKDRLLGCSTTVSLPNRAVWLGSGNNTRLSREMLRRTVWCRLDAKLDAPWERSEFRHPNLVQWAKENRGRLVAAVLTLVQAWIVAGRPSGGATLGMFDDWAAVIGGVLKNAGIAGLFANAQQFRAASVDTVAEWRVFVACWSQSFGDRKVGVE